MKRRVILIFIILFLCDVPVAMTLPISAQGRPDGPGSGNGRALTGHWEDHFDNATMIDEKGPGIVLTDSAAMVKGELLEADANTILLLHFDEGAGNVVYDTGPHSFRGAVNHSDEGDWPAGISGTAIDLDGEFDYVDVPYNETFNPGNKVTVEAWIYQRSAMPYQGSTVVTKRGGYLLTTDGFLIDTVSGVKWANRMNYTVLDEWTYIVGTFDGKDLHYYVNGRLSGSGNSTDPMEQQINNIRVGAADLDLGDGGDPFYLFDGMIEIDKLHFKLLRQFLAYGGFPAALVSDYKKSHFLNKIDTVFTIAVKFCSTSQRNSKMF